MSSAEVANPKVANPNGDEGSPQSPSNPIETMEIEQESNDNNNILPDNNDSTDNILNNEAKQDDDNDNDNDMDDKELQTLQSSPNHHRENDVSTNKIIPIVNELNPNENEKDNIANDHNEPPQTQNENENDNMANDKDSDIKPQINNAEQKENIQSKQVLKIEHGHCSMQGIRPTMEDCVVVEPVFSVYGSKCTSNNLSIYGVFDGHGGKQCAEYCSQNFCKILKKYLLSETDINEAFTLCISELDEKAIEYAKDASGSTACIILIDTIKYDLYCCNVGDSRAILINHSFNNAKQLSIEHKPEYPMEKQRIENANGWVTFGRVCGILAVSRSLGDKDFKYEIENLIISTPDITHHKIVLGEDQYIVLACDGLYDVFTNEQCMEWMDKTIATNGNNEMDNNMQEITNKLCHSAIHDRKSKDNVSVLVLNIDFIDIANHMNNNDNDFEGCEELDDVKDSDKIYNSTSSNGSVGSPNNHSLQSQISNQSNQSNESDDKMNENKVKNKHKFHVVMESDDINIDKLAQNINEINENDI